MRANGDVTETGSTLVGVQTNSGSSKAASAADANNISGNNVSNQTAGIVGNNNITYGGMFRGIGTAAQNI